MKPSTNIVVYKDNANAPTMYFGPFVSIQIASDFSRALPEPFKGGFKKYAITQPFTHNETSLVTDLIMVGRKELHHV